MKQKKFIERFGDLISTLKNEDSPLIPKVQIEELEYYPIFNPELTVSPRDWWKHSFDWFVVIPVIPGGEYGPFYRIGGPHFWPTIGNSNEVYSENQCFYGLKKPKNKQEAKDLYKLQNENELSHTHKIILPAGLAENVTLNFDHACFFIGPTYQGKGFQVNPNMRIVDIVRHLYVVGITPEILPD